MKNTISLEIMETKYIPWRHIMNLVSTEPRDTITVADVHTDLNSEMVLEEGTGYLKVLLVAFKLPDSRIFIGAGPVLTYYEFKHPMRDRLNDKSWKQLLSSKSCPNEPEWISEYSI